MPGKSEPVVIPHERGALASVGEFAASLAHEVRNPLTSIRVDLQRIEEALPEDSETRDLLQRALSQVERLDHSVSGALRVARSGHIESKPVDLRESLRAAAHEAEPAFARRPSIPRAICLPKPASSFLTVCHVGDGAMPCSLPGQRSVACGP